MRNTLEDRNLPILLEKKTDDLGVFLNQSYDSSGGVHRILRGFFQDGRLSYK